MASGCHYRQLDAPHCVACLDISEIQRCANVCTAYGKTMSFPNTSLGNDLSNWLLSPSVASCARWWRSVVSCLPRHRARATQSKKTAIHLRGYIQIQYRMFVYLVTYLSSNDT
eukprot:4029215-Pleurochrysis_carterae.AAC.12